MTKRPVDNSHPPVSGGPLIVAPSLWQRGEKPGTPLDDEDRALLAVIATIVRFRKGETIYEKGHAAGSVFNIVSGMVKSFMPLPDRKQYILGFLFPGDLVGLAQHGMYVNSAEAVTPVTAYRMPTAALEARLRRNPGLDFMVICKLCHDLRESQSHAYLTSKRSAIARLGLFLQMIETNQASLGSVAGEVYLPMRRKDIGAYIGISPEAVTRSLRDLVRRRAIRMRDRRHLRIIDRTRLENAISEFDPARGDPPG
jgi:CRP/FNR family transcriptional regulator